MAEDTKFSEQQVLNRFLDELSGTGRVTLFPASAKRIVDTATTNIVYVGVAAAGSATSKAGGWLIEKIDTSVANTVTITHATDSWDNRGTAAYS